ncbi:MAG: nucleoside deaminase [Desulfobulbus sp.]|nr:MAG: nucleoside deaminase [Desulfobulbus sp.]
MTDLDRGFMRRAIDLARQGMEKGEGGPFGALIVRDGEVIGSGWNRVLATNDPTAHAEVVAIRDACRRLGSYWLEGSAIYVNCEPCPMCLAAIHWARIGSLYFAATRKDAAAIDFADDDIYREVCLPPQERVMPAQQLLGEEAREIMRRWPDLAERRPY